MTRNRSPSPPYSAVLGAGSWKGSRRPEAFQILQGAWKNALSASERLTFLQAIALLRLDDATQFLLEQVRTGGTPAGEAIEALRLPRSATR